MEDDERMASLLKRGLEKEGHVATLTADGPEGLDFAMSRTEVLAQEAPRLLGLRLDVYCAFYLFIRAHRRTVS